MFKIIFNYSVIAALCLLPVACGTSEATDRYTDTSGYSGRFSDHRGQWLVINYWAIWCKPCIQEIPELNHFAGHHKKQISVFSVNYDGKQGQTLIEQSKKLGIAFPTLTSDPSHLLGFERPTVLPTTVILNKAGKLHKTLIGPQTQQSLEQALLQ